MWLNGLCALQDEKNQIMKSNVWLRMVNTSCLKACSCFSALTLLVGRQEEHPACNKVSGGGETICLPRRWQFGGGKNRGSPQSAHLW